MSKKDNTKQAEAPQQEPKAVTLADVLEGKEGVSVSDDKRLRVTAEDKETLAERVTTVKSALSDYNITVSPVYGNAEALGCVWNDLVVTPKK